jgi:hypothetical protein
LEKITKQFTLDPETPTEQFNISRVRYSELNSNGQVASPQDCTIETLYVRKKVLGSDIPRRLTITINFE